MLSSWVRVSDMICKKFDCPPLGGGGGAVYVNNYGTFIQMFPKFYNLHFYVRIALV